MQSFLIFMNQEKLHTNLLSLCFITRQFTQMYRSNSLFKEIYLFILLKNLRAESYSVREKIYKLKIIAKIFIALALFAPHNNACI